MNVSLVSTPPDRNNPVSLTMVCGSSSLLIHMTAVPALIFNDVGANMKSLIAMRAGPGGAAFAQVLAGADTKAVASIANKVRVPRLFMEVPALMRGWCRQAASGRDAGRPRRG